MWTSIPRWAICALQLEYANLGIISVKCSNVLILLSERISNCVISYNRICFVFPLQPQRHQPIRMGTTQEMGALLDACSREQWWRYRRRWRRAARTRKRMMTLPHKKREGKVLVIHVLRSRVCYGFWACSTRTMTKKRQLI